MSKQTFVLNSQGFSIQHMWAALKREMSAFIAYVSRSGRPSSNPFIYLIIALLLLSYETYAINQDQLFLNDGREITVSVYTCEMRSSRSGPYASISYDYIVDEHTYTGRTEMGKNSSCRNYPVGTHIAGLYLVSDPSVSRAPLYPGSSERQAMIYAFIVGVVLLIILYLSLKALNLIRCYWREKPASPLSASQQQKDLRQQFGSVCRILDGEIVAVEGYERDQYFMLRVYYQFISPSQAVIGHYAEARRDDLREGHLPARGTPIHVLYADDQHHTVL